MQHHVLRMQVSFCNAKLAGSKPFEVRENDRDFQAGDTVEFVAVTPNGERVPHDIEGIRYEIPYVLREVGLLPGWVAFTTRKIFEEKNPLRLPRLTSDSPDGNFETMLNFVYGKGGWAHIRSDGETDDVLLTEWTKRQCIAHGCEEFGAETPEDIDAAVCDCAFDYGECPVFLAYTFATQALHLRTRLKMIEDFLTMEAGEGGR